MPSATQSGSDVPMQTDVSYPEGALSDEAFLQLPDEDKLRLYRELSARNHQLMSHIKIIDENLEKGAQLATLSKVQSTKPVRSFLRRDIGVDTKCLVIGDSHVSYMPLSNFPMDTEIQSFSGIRITELNKLFMTYPEKSLNCVTILVGTNSVLNENIDVNYHINEYAKLIETVCNTFCPRAVFLCSIPPHRVSEKHNIEIKKFNLLMQSLTKAKTNVEIINIGEKIMDAQSKMDVFKKDDNVHMNEEITSLMVNMLLEKIFQYSDKIPRIKKELKTTRTLSKRGQPSSYRPYPHPRVGPRYSGHVPYQRYSYQGAYPQ